MSQTQTTQTTNDTTLDASPKAKRGRPAKSTIEYPETKREVYEPKAKPVVKEKTLSLSDLDGQKEVEMSHEARMKMAESMMRLESAVVLAKHNKTEWIEIDRDLLVHLNGGTFPEVGYFVFKGVKVCLEDTATDIAAREGMTCHEIVFPKDQFTCGVRYVGK